MWSDGWSSIRTWTNLYNDYELTHCCFGEDGESSDSGGYGEETGLTADQAAQAAAAADAAAAAGLSGEAQQAAADAAAAEAAGFSSVDDYAQSEGFTAADPSLSDLEGLYDADIFGYNKMDSFDYFDKKDAAVDAAMQAQADKRTEDLAAQGIAADVNYDPVTGTYTYDAPTFGQAIGVAAGDVAGSFGRGIAGAMDTIGELANPVQAAVKGASGYGAGPGTISGAVGDLLGKGYGMSTATRAGISPDPFQMPDVKTLDDFNREAIEKANREAELSYVGLPVNYEELSMINTNPLQDQNLPTITQADATYRQSVAFDPNKGGFPYAFDVLDPLTQKKDYNEPGDLGLGSLRKN